MIRTFMDVARPLVISWKPQPSVTRKGRGDESDSNKFLCHGTVPCMAAACVTKTAKEMELFSITENTCTYLSTVSWKQFEAVVHLVLAQRRTPQSSKWQQYQLDEHKHAFVPFQAQHLPSYEMYTRVYEHVHGVYKWVLPFYGALLGWDVREVQTHKG